jgi:hypothetical protein
VERRTLGRTGLEVSLLGFGGSEIGFLAPEPADVDRLLNEALDLGLNVIDTAECYMDSEARIGRFVSKRRDEFYLFSKLGHRFENGPDLPDWHPDLLRASIDHSLAALQVEHLDLLQVHSCRAEVLEVVIPIIEQAKADGKTRFLGYSGDGDDAVKAMETGVFDVLQTSCNIADQESIGLLLPIAKAKNIGVIVKRPIANVAWINGDEPPAWPYAMTYWERLQKLRYPFLGLPPAESVSTALRFTAAQDISTMIVGTTKPGRWPENAAMLTAGPLPQEDVAAIRERWTEVAEPSWVGQT